MGKCSPECKCKRHRVRTSEERLQRRNAALKQHSAGILGRHKLSADDTFTRGKERSGYKVLRPKMLEYGIPHVCALCGQVPLWNDAPLVLQVDHADGDRSNCQLDNLWFLCPNCHTQQPTSINKPFEIRGVNKDTFGTMWRRQLAFTSLVLSTVDTPLDQLTDDDRVRLTRDYVEYLHSELVEVLNNVPWKKHRYLGAANRDNLLEELIDCQKFLFGLMMIWNINPKELGRAFDRKSDVVDQRFKQEHLLPKQVANDKVVIVDIDDVVAGWEQGFEDWVGRLGENLNPEDYAKHIDPGLRERLKSRIHSSGGMLELPLLFGSNNAIDTLQKEGYTIVWLTARPVGKHPRLIADTVAWLKKNNLPTEYIYWSDLNKHLFVVQKFPTAAVLFDDKAETVAHASEFGIRSYLVSYDDCFLGQVDKFLEDVKE